MRIFRSLEEVPADFGTSIVSVGNFDGVHIGHQLVLKEMVKRARAPSPTRRSWSRLTLIR